VAEVDACDCALYFAFIAEGWKDASEDIGINFDDTVITRNYDISYVFCFSVLELGGRLFFLEVAELDEGNGSTVAIVHLDGLERPVLPRLASH